MSHTVVALTLLTDEGVRADHERRLRAVDAPTAAAMPGVLGFRVLRLEGPVLDGFRTAMAGPGGAT